MRRYKDDKNIKNTLEYEAENIDVSPDLFNKIRKNIYEEEQKSMRGNWFKGKKRIGLIIAICVVAGSITAIARPGIIEGISDVKYRSFPSEKQVEEDNGFLPKYVESFPGGFEFTQAFTGESGFVSGKQEKEIDFYYAREGEDKHKLNLSLDTSLIDKTYVSEENREKVFTYKGIDLYYLNMPFKFVPGDYEPTEEEKARQEAGELAISYGEDKIIETVSQSMSWYEDGIRYTISGRDYNFTVDELIEMAKQVIDVR